MYTVKEFNSRDALQDCLNGAVLGSPLAKLTFGLHDKTLIITPAGEGASAVTVTFSDATGSGLSPSAILSAIKAAGEGESEGALDGQVALRNYGYTNPQNPQLAIIGVGASLDGDGTANALLGLPEVDTEIAEVSTTAITDFELNPTGPLYVLILHS